MSLLIKQTPSPLHPKPRNVKGFAKKKENAFSFE